MTNPSCLSPVEHQRLDLWVRYANNAASDFTYPFTIEGKRIGRLIEPHYYALAAMADLFQVGDGVVSFPRNAKSLADRSDVFADAIERLVSRGQIDRAQIRNEVYGAMGAWGERPQFVGERGGFPFFGLKNFGVHVHGVTGNADLWMGRRSETKNTDPGKLDQIAAGGQPLELSLKDNMIKECWEEAGIPAALAQTAGPSGIVPIRHINQYGYIDLDLHIYDLALPQDFIPQNQDGEVQGFERHSAQSLIAMLLEDAETRDLFPGDVAICLLEWLARKGFVDEQLFSHPIRIPA